jgi:DMATS type aromatic prenyltransferase
MLAVDNVSPAKSRLKFYFQAPNTSFLSTRNIMTLGGRIPVPEERLQELRTLIIAVTGVEQDFPEDAALPISHQFNPPIKDANNDRTLALPGYGYYFDIAPDQALPEIKIFIRLSVNGLDDLSVARGLTGWMEARGRGVYCRAFLSMLQSLCSYRQLDEVKGVHTHVSCLFKKNGDLDITSYLAPEISTRAVMLRQEAQGSNGNGVVEVRSGHI